MVTAVMTTYDDGTGIRFEYAARCVRALGIWCNPEPAIILADDGSPCGPPQIEVDSIVTGPHNGIGASLNRALSQVRGNWMYTTDDWLLIGPLHLELPLWLLDQGYDLVRIGPPHPNVRCTTNFQAGHGWWLDIDVYSNQYACATRPFVAAPSLMEKIGPWTEGVDSYRAEIDFGLRCQMYDVIAAQTTLHGPWEHIGEYEVGDRPIT